MFSSNIVLLCFVVFMIVGTCLAAHSNGAPNLITEGHGPIRVETQSMEYEGYQGTPYQDGLYDTQNQGIFDQVYAGVQHTKYTKQRPVGNDYAKKEDKIQSAQSNVIPTNLHHVEAHGIDVEGQYIPKWRF